MRHTEDRGATLVELSIVALVVFTLIFGIFEFGMLFRDRLSVHDAVASGTRAGTVHGRKLGPSNETADYYLIRAIREETSSIDPIDIEQIVVFKGRSPGAGDAASQVPAACKRGTPVAGVCNVYDPNEAFLRVQSGDVGYFSCRATPGGPACPWDPEGRADGPALNQIDYLGVWMRVDNPLVTGMFGTSISIEAAAVGRLEPGVLE